MNKYTASVGIVLACFFMFLLQKLFSYDFVFSLKTFYNLIPAAFAHLNLDHLFWNVLSLIFVGPAIEKRYGGLKMFLIFIITSSVGFIVSVATGSSSGTLGASAGIFGLYAFYPFTFTSRLPKIVFSIVILCLILSNVILFSTSFLIGGASINYLGHIFGFLAGLLLIPDFHNSSLIDKLINLHKSKCLKKG